MQIRNKQIDILNDTIQITREGRYLYENKYINLCLQQTEMQEALAFLPDEVINIVENADVSLENYFQRCEFFCQNMDSYTMAQEQYRKGARNILVLNFANPVRPGGGVRIGSRAQEEDLCRSSTLLLSLESTAAKRYYQYNIIHDSALGTDAILLSPKVEVFKDLRGQLLAEPFLVGVITCGAPMLVRGLEGLSPLEYTELFHKRVLRMLKCAAVWGYDSLILGAFGCGEFGNDSSFVAELFYTALAELGCTGNRSPFRSVGFAVLDKSEELYNFKQFFEKFSPLCDREK